MFKEPGSGKAEPASKEIEQPFRFRILHSAHDQFWTEEELVKELKNADIWFPENLGWTDEMETILKTFATGKYAIPKNMDVAPDLKTQLEALRIVGKEKELSVGFIDFPETHPLMRFTDAKPSNALFSYVHGDFQNAVREMRRYAQKESSLEKAREQYMEDNARTKIQDIINEHPHLREKRARGEKISVLMTLGTFHTKVAHDLKKQGEEVEQRFNHELPYAFAPHIELLRQYHFNKEISDKTAAQALFYFTLFPQFDFLKDDAKADQIANKISRSVPLEIIKTLSAKLSKGQTPNQAFKELDIRIPRSEKEVDELLSQN